MIVCSHAEGQRIASGVQTRITRPIGKKGYRLGSVHGVQRGAYTKPWCYVRIVACPCINLGALTDADAMLEGYTSLDAFKSHWRSTHGNGRFQSKLPVWDIRLVRVDKPTKVRQETIDNLFTRLAAEEAQ